VRPLLRLFGNGGASFFVSDSLVQDQPDQPTLSMGNGPDGLLVPETRYRAVVDKLEDASFSPGCGVGRLVENTPHVAVPLRGSVAIVHAPRSRCRREQAPTQEESFFSEGKVAAVAPTSAMICCAESTPSPGTSASRSTES